jgi:hypothetical protein
MHTPLDSRRGFVKKAAYVAPAILTLAAAPAFAKAGSEKHEKGLRGPKPDNPRKLYRGGD